MAEGLSLKDLGIVFFTGFLPPLLWLWFWLKEDPHPEPRKALIASFAFGMAVVPVVLLLEYLWYRAAFFAGFARAGELTGLILLIPWAFIEEVAKFSVAWWADLKRSVYDEPVDAMIYLITVALGFAAAENMLFLLKSIGAGDDIFTVFITADLRFLGATLLHTVAAGTIGSSIAFSFFHPEHHLRNIWGGIILATILHTAFNIFIIEAESSDTLFKTFFSLWTLAVILIFFFEKVKKLKS